MTIEIIYKPEIGGNPIRWYPTPALGILLFWMLGAIFCHSNLLGEGMCPMMYLILFKM